MFGSAIIDVAIGLIFVYFLLSSISSYINDFIARIMQWRSKDLEHGIRGLLSDPNLAEKVWNHPLVQGLGGKEGKDPTYIPPNTFALALFDAIVPSGNNPSAMQTVRTTVSQMPDDSLKQALLSMIDKADGDITKARAEVESWFNAAMDRVTAVYRQRIQILTLFVALATTLIFGVDSLAIANSLYREPALRAAVTGSAQLNSSTGVAPTENANLQDTIKTLSGLALPLGWNDLPKDTLGWFQKVAGLILTTLAVSLGAPFWYDLLKNLSSLRPPAAR